MEVALLGHEGGGKHGLVSVALPGKEGSAVRPKKESDNQHVVVKGHSKVQGWGEGRRPPQPPLETTSLAPAEVPRWHSSQGWMLLCGSKARLR